MSRRNTDGPTRYNKDSTINYIIDACIYVIARICVFANIRCTDRPGHRSVIFWQTCCCPQLPSAAKNSWNRYSNFLFALHDVFSAVNSVERLNNPVYSAPPVSVQCCEMPLSVPYHLWQHWVVELFQAAAIVISTIYGFLYIYHYASMLTKVVFIADSSVSGNWK